MGQVLPIRFGQDNPQPKAKKIQYDAATKTLQVPNHVSIPIIEGDGIGPEIMKATKKVVDKALKLAYGTKRSITWVPMIIGEKALAAGKKLIPDETLDTIEGHRVFLKGPVNTPLGKGFRSVNVALRSMFDLNACIRPLKSIPGVITPLKNDNIDLVLFRENTDDIYQGIEFAQGSDEAKALIELLNTQYDANIALDSGIGIKPMSETKSKRFVQQAIQYAIDHHRPSLTLVGKANIMKFTEGAFLKWGQQVAKEQFGDRIVLEKDFWDQYGGDAKKLPEGSVVLKQRLTDAMMMELIKKPEQHSVIVTTNLNGDLLSDEGAGLIGGLGVAPGANVGDGYAMFESTHGSAPDIAGQNLANPTALLRTASLMLDHLGWKKAADKITQGIKDAIAHGQMTGDLAKEVNEAGGVKRYGFRRKVESLGTDAFGDAVIAQMERVQKRSPVSIITEGLNSTLNRLTGSKKKAS